MQAHAFHTAHQTLPASDPSIILVDVGTACWLVAYTIAIVVGFKQKTYVIPMGAIASNFTWEVLASFEWIAPVKLWHIGAVLWMLFDASIVYQLFRYGAAQQTIPELKRWFAPITIVVFALALVGQSTYADYYGDQLGFEDAYMINTTMSILFIVMYFARRDASNATFAIAWFKLFGTGLTSIGLVRAFPTFYPQRTEFSFMYFLYVTIAMFDLAYIALLWRQRRSPQGAGA